MTLSLRLALRGVFTAPLTNTTTLISVRGLHASRSWCAKRWRTKAAPPFQAELKNPVDAVFNSTEVRTSQQAENGYIYDKKPFKVGYN